ncbi:Uncharacterized protein Rs2_06150 [Raphanus sativus]|nr:Uncharacterized protein Rs2_06150 [Raphanus sativus]
MATSPNQSSCSISQKPLDHGDFSIHFSEFKIGRCRQSVQIILLPLTRVMLTFLSPIMKRDNEARDSFETQMRVQAHKQQSPKNISPFCLRLLKPPVKPEREKLWKIVSLLSPILKEIPNSGAILHPARRFESWPVLAVEIQQRQIPHTTATRTNHNLHQVFGGNCSRRSFRTEADLTIDSSGCKVLGAHHQDYSTYNVNDSCCQCYW